MGIITNQFDQLDHTTTTVTWQDMLRRTTIRRFLVVFAPMIASFSMFNLIVGNLIVGWLEAFLTLTVLATWRFGYRIDVGKVEHLCIMQVAILIYAFIFFPAVGDSAYVWAIGLPFFTSYLSGFRNSLKWSVGFGVVILLSGMIAWQMGIQLYWPWAMAPYLLLAYATMALFACFFALKSESHIAMLEMARQQAKSSAKSLSDSESRYRTLLKSSLNGVAVHRHGKWIYANPACLKLFAAESLDKILGTPIVDYIHPDDRDKVLQRIAKMQQGKAKLPFLEEELLRCNGESFFAEVRATPIVFDGEEAFMVTLNDISERKRNELLQREVEHSQRLESLGILAGGIAHDFNNLLTAILGNAELALLKTKPDASTRQHLTIIKDTSNKAASLCQQMLAYAGKGQTKLSSIDLNGMISKMEQLIQVSISKDIDIQHDFDNDLPIIEADASQLQQVILNFIVNGAEAIGNHAGKIHIKTGIVESDDHTHYYSATNIQDNDYIFFEISDSGCGMDEATVEKIFDPFFSTKNRGSGLGLSAVMGIIRQHQGDVAINSELGHGTTFRVILPLHKTTDHSQMDSGEHTSLSEIKLAGRVLLVDDDFHVRQAAAQMLTYMNLELLEAEDGLEAVEMFQQHQDIALVVMDITMPRLAGVEAMRRMRAIDDSIPVVLMSGYSKVSLSELQSHEQPNAFVQKPFNAEALKHALQSVI